ncbi:glycerate kinase [Dothidotthia symphoricarpi CBS 119687]|uniref:Glycerate kinase n=1 Tax=Dothidotthia symphoricarpi CBS 119687 TaxID=1392245 RepID=A0A6A6AAH3_9PLEO|nr:glycerate kinase [Dothidotthia symphoricarpi CBS 119687]KAF2128800.1 glycerate kinase [Dothidotthia symphoricarpi CBS 119687]
MPEFCTPVSLPSAPAVRPRPQRRITLKTSGLPQVKVDELVHSASPARQTPTTELQSLLDENPLRILIAPSGFKESLGPEQIASAIETGVRKVLDRKAVIVQKLPLHDGGEGFARALVAVQGGEVAECTVTGPIGLPVESHLGFVGEDRKTAVLDMAAAAGLRLVPKDCRDPTVTTTYGVGQLMRKALDAGCTKIIIGCGDSGTSDGGAGMLQALGVRLLDANGKELPRAAGGRSLTHLDQVCWESIHPRLRKDGGEQVQIEAVCNIKNVICGPKGVARVYGPQKGATPEQVDLLASALERLAHIAEITLGKDISRAPGSGASGGLGTGLMMLGTTLRARADAINEYFGLDHVLNQRWDFVITAEGSLDSQSTEGKMTTEVARRAKQSGAAVVALAGSIGEGAERVLGSGIQAFTSILKEPLTLDEAILQTETLVMDGAENMLRMIMVGLALGRRHF